MKLSRSEVVTNAILKSVQKPTTGPQFERDFKAFKTDLGAKLDYLLNTVGDAENIKKIFKSSLEADILMEIVKVFNHGLNSVATSETLGDMR